MKYGDKRDYRKINFYCKKTGRYIVSTTWSKTCKEAMEHYIKFDQPQIGFTPMGVKASYKSSPFQL